MKKTLLIAIIVLFFTGCNMNPSKEARIQALETEILKTIDKINTLEKKIDSLDDINDKLNTRITELEKR